MPVKMASTDEVWFHGFWFDVCPGVYKPAEDSFMLAEAALRENAKRILEVGTGCGIVSILLSKSGSTFTVATDVSTQAIRCARQNAAKLGAQIHLILCDMFTAISGLFDLVVFNAPYLISEEGAEGDVSLDGGPEGRNLIDVFIKSVVNFLSERGKALMIQSSLNDLERTAHLAERFGLKSVVVEVQSFFFERLYAVKFTKYPK